MARAKRRQNNLTSNKETQQAGDFFLVEQACVKHVPWSRLSRFFGDGHPTFKRNLYKGYINPYYWVDDHPLLYGNNGSLDPGTCLFVSLERQG